MVTFSQLQLDAWLTGILLPFVRVLALFSAAPLLSNRSFPARARIAAAAAVAVVVAPLAQVPPGLTLASAMAPLLVAQQVLVGLALGFAARLLFAAFELAGEVVGLQMGLSFAGFFDPHGGRETATGSWLHTLAMMLFLALDGHLVLIDALAATFRSVPISEQPLAGFSRLRLDQLGQDVFRLALVLALPATILLLFVNLALGLISRVAPQLNIFAVGFPATLLAGLAALALGTPHLLQALTDGLRLFLAPFR